MAQRSKLCEADSEQTILGAARGRDVGSSSLFTPTKNLLTPLVSGGFSVLIRDSKDERYRATVQWTVVTASDQAPAGARVESLHSDHNKG